MMSTLAMRDIQIIWPDFSINPRYFGYVLGALAVFLAIRGSILLMRSLRRRVRPLMVYNRVAAQLGVAADDRVFLWRIARRCKLESAMALLMSPATLDHHAAAAASKLSGPSAAALRRRAAAISAALFGEATVSRETAEPVA